MRNTRENTSKSHAMTPETMRLAVAGIGYSLAELSKCMAIPYRTLQDYYYGKRSIPAEFADKLHGEAEKASRIMAEVFAGIDQAAAKVPLIITPKED